MMGGMRLMAGAALLAGIVGAPSAAAMSYRLIDTDLPNCRGNCPKVIYASGTIGQHEYLELSAFIQEAGQKGIKVSQVMLIESPGGFTGGATVLGLFIRKMKMQVVVGRPVAPVVTATSGLTAGTCASACTYVLMGGVKRTYTKNSRIGVHRSHNGGDVIDPITKKNVNFTVDRAAADEHLTKYFRIMGVDAGLIKLINDTPSETIHWLTPAEMKRYRVASGT